MSIIPRVEEGTLENDVMDDHAKFAITEDTESVDLKWFQNTKLNRVKNGTRCLLQVGVRDGESLGTSPSMIQKAFVKRLRKSWMPKRMEKMRFTLQKDHEWRDEFLYHVPPDVEPQNRDFDVNEFLRSIPNPIVASILGDSEIVQRAAVRRGYPVMKSQFLNLGDDIHDQ